MSALCTNEVATTQLWILIITAQSCFHDAIFKNASFVSNCIIVCVSIALLLVAIP